MIRSSIFRFLVSGAINTLLSWGLYLLLLPLLSYRPSYTLAYLAGIAISFLLNRFYVFKTSQGVRSLASFPLVYLAQYLLGLLVLWAWIDVLSLSAGVAPLVATGITLPVTYMMSRLVFTGRGRRR